MRTKKLTYASLFLALAIIIPQAFHLTGVVQSGAIFLPMHIPVLLAGLMLGPSYGLSIGIIAPIVSSVLTGMPATARLPFMIMELAGYGLMSGLLFHTLKLSKKKLGSLLALVGSMVFGRLVYALAILLFAALFNLQGGGLMAVSSAITLGIPGIIIQLILIPIIIESLRKTGFLNEFIR